MHIKKIKIELRKIQLKKYYTVLRAPFWDGARERMKKSYIYIYIYKIQILYSRRRAFSTRFPFFSFFTSFSFLFYFLYYQDTGWNDEIVRFVALIIIITHGRPIRRHTYKRAYTHFAFSSLYFLFFVITLKKKKKK